jgi:hypothetical protein
MRAEPGSSPSGDPRHLVVEIEGVALIVMAYSTLDIALLRHSIRRNYKEKAAN